MKLSCCSGVTCLLLASQAFAQPPPGPMVEGEGNATQSVLPNLLATSAGTLIDARLDFTMIDDAGADLTLFAINLHAQHITPGNVGGYVSLPYGYVDVEGFDSQSGIGNLEIGGLYAIRNSPDTDILLRGGLALDTADEEDAGLVPVANVAPRLTDWVSTGLDTTWLRLQGQLRHANGNLRLGAMGGFDLPIDGAGEEADGFDGVFNLAGAIGFETPGFGISFALAYAKMLVDGDDDEADIFNFNAIIDFPVGARSRLYGALGIPDLDNLDENEGDIFSIGVGIRAGL